MTQESGCAFLKKLAIDLIAADSPSAFLDHPPNRKPHCQILGSAAQFEKAMPLAKLPVARERTGKMGGPHPVPEAHRKTARRLRNEGLTQRATFVLPCLEAEGVVGHSGKPYETMRETYYTLAKRLGVTLEYERARHAEHGRIYLPEGSYRPAALGLSPPHPVKPGNYPRYQTLTRSKSAMPSGKYGQFNSARLSAFRLQLYLGQVLDLPTDRNSAIDAVLLGDGGSDERSATALR